MKVGEVPDLPEGVADHLEESGISELYPPQAAAVEAGVAEGRSLVASVPTASGKTMIATLAMLSAIERGGKALYIVPLRALAGEKRDEFAQYEQQGVTVGMSIGDYENTDDWLGTQDIIVATSEKVDSLVRNGADWINDLTCVVADEVHLVDDAGRGPTLEVTLAKLRRRAPDLQVVALSATVGNADEIAEWLDAALVDSNWRPIDLRTGVYYGNAINFDDGEQYELPQNGEQTETVVRDTLADEGSTLVFVNSRRNAEAAARRLADVVEPMLGSEDRRGLAEVADEIRDVSDTETSRDLAAAVEKGAAFHHAGLASQHRKLVEDAFRARQVKVVSATPTLAAGVNTPSRRVVVRDWRRYDSSAGGMAPLSTLEVHQMFGRAGRPGLDPYGEAVLLASSHDEMEELFDRYIWADPEPVRSKLAAEPALRTHVLATVATGFATTRSGLLDFLDETLYATQTPERSHIEAVTDNVLAYLEANDFVHRDGDDLNATSIGHTVSRLYLDPMSAATIIDGLRAADEQARIAAENAAANAGDEEAEDEVTERDFGPSALGLYHLVSRTPDMYQLYLRSGDREKYTELAYEREPELPGRSPSEFEQEWEDWLSALKTAKLLEDWSDEVDEDRICERYGVGPGDVRGKVDVAEWLLSAAERLAAELDVQCTPAVREARMRVEHGVRKELLDLVGVRGVGRKRARRLHRAGIESPADLREAPKPIVLRALRGRRKTAENVLRNAGREDPEMDDVEQAEDGAVPEAVVEAEDDEPAEASAGSGAGGERAAADQDQANLGDFG